MPTVASLFSGAGGLDLGFIQAGYDVLFANDYDKHACATYRENIGDHIIEKRIEDLDIESIPQVDVIIGGPPCQGFSLTGTRKKSDKRNTLFNSVFRLSKKVNPQAIIIENVPGIINLYGGAVKNEILKCCNEMGYSCSYKILYAPDFGIPQIRKRAFFVMLRGKKK